MAIIVLGGLYAGMNLVREGFPEVGQPAASVVTIYPGASSIDAETQVTNPLEDVIAAEVDDINTLTSSSQNGISTISVIFESDVNESEAFRELREVVDQARAELPEGAETPSVEQFALGADFDIRIGLTDTSSDAIEYATLFEQASVLQERIEGIDGVARVQIVGERAPIIDIALSADALRDNNISVTDVQQALQASNIDIPGGTIQNAAGGTVSVRTLGSFQSIDDIRQTIVSQSVDARGIPSIVRLQDIATITETSSQTGEILRLGTTTDQGLQGNDALFLDIKRVDSFNVTDVHDAVLTAIDTLHTEDRLRDTLVTEVVFSGADDVRTQLDQLVTNGWQGLLIIFVVLMIFINPRGSISVVVIVPLVLLLTLLILLLNGLTLNVMVLFSLILTMGLVVDNAIVIVEAIQFHIEKGKKKREAAIAALTETGPAILAATVTTMLVFIPMLFLPGITGEVVKLLPITVLSAIAGSVFVALSVTPFIATVIMRGPEQRKKGHKEWKIVRGYGTFMRTILTTKWKYIALVAAVVLFGASMSLPATGTLGSEQWPPVDGDYAFMNVSIEPEQPESDLRDAIAFAEAELQHYNDIVDSYSFIAGGGDLFGIAGSPTSAFGIIRLTPTDERDMTSITLAQEINEQAKGFDRADIELDAGEVGPPQADADISYQLSGPNIDQLEQLSQELATVLAQRDDVSSVEDGVAGQQTEELQIILKRDTLEQHGLNPAMAGAAVRSILTTSSAGTLRSVSSDQPDRELILSVDGRSSVETIKDIPVSTFSGNTVRLEDIATIEQGLAPSAIRHFDQDRYVQGNIVAAEGADIEAIKTAISDYLTEEKREAFNLSEDALTFRGQFEEDAESFASIGSIFLIAILLMYLVLAGQFNSLTQPLLILLAVPLALTLVFPTLALFNESLSFLASIGVVALAGVVVNDAIVYLSYINTLRTRDGMNLTDAIVEAGKVRLKPILSTTITTAGGILPLTITVPFWKGMGLTLISGLIMATIGTLVVVPVVYRTCAGAYGRIKARIKRKKQAA